MIREELERLIDKGESETLEFKDSFNHESIETAGAFANTKGGCILIGVRDDGIIIGAKDRRESVNAWVNDISQNTDSRIVPDVEITHTEKGNVVAIRIKELPIKPVSARSRYY